MKCQWRERARDHKGRNISPEFPQVPPSKHRSGGKGDPSSRKCGWGEAAVFHSASFQDWQIQRWPWDDWGGRDRCWVPFRVVHDSGRSFSEKSLSSELDLARLLVTLAAKGSQMLHFRPVRRSSLIFHSFSTSSVIFWIRKLCVFSLRMDSTRVSSPLGFSSK